MFFFGFIMGIAGGFFSAVMIFAYQEERRRK